MHQPSHGLFNLPKPLEARVPCVLKGRGALDNPVGRFETRRRAADLDTLDELQRYGEIDLKQAQVKTQVFPDQSRTVISNNDSPDLCMATTFNPYRGCAHGCIYCYARPTHEYLGLSAGLNFETKIFAKYDAPQLLIETLSAKKWQPRTVSISGITDPYQPLEKQLEITRQSLQVFAAFHNPIGIITKNHLVTRDIDILQELATHNAAMVHISLTTLDGELARKMEPRTSQPKLRLKAIEALAKAGIPVGMIMGPVIPGLTEHEIPKILAAAANAGARSAGYTMMRLPHGVKDLFQSWIREHYPDKAARVLARVREVRDGKLNDANFGTRMRGTGVYAEYIAQLFAMSKKRYGLVDNYPPLSIAAFKRDAYERQMSLF